MAFSGVVVFKSECESALEICQRVDHSELSADELQVKFRSRWFLSLRAPHRARCSELVLVRATTAASRPKSVWPESSSDGHHHPPPLESAPSPTRADIANPSARVQLAAG